MRCGWWLALPLAGWACTALADGADAPAAESSAAERAAGAEAVQVGAPPPALDLGFDPRVVSPRRPTPPPTALVNGTRRRGFGQGAETPLSLKVKMRPRNLEPTRRKDEDVPASGLREDLERAIEETTFGVTGTYRF